MAAFMVGMALLQVALMAIDPFNQYPWSPVREVPDEAQGASISGYFLNVAARGSYDTVIYGGSPLQPFRSRDVEATLPGVRHAVNLTYPGFKPRDIGFVFDRLAAFPGSLRRVVTSLDYIYFLPIDEESQEFPFRIYRSGPDDRILIGDPQAMQFATSIVLHGRIAVDREVGGPLPPHWPLHPMASSAPGPAPRCEDIAALGATLIPAAQSLSRRGVAFDVIVPPYALTFYLSVPPFSPEIVTVDYQLALRRCAVEALSKIPGARVFAFDDPWIVGNPANFDDPGHLHPGALFHYMLTEMAAGRHQLTLENFPQYAASLRAQVLRYSATLPSDKEPGHPHA